MAAVTDIGRALDAIARGEIIGLPTDTVYGIAADPFNEHAVKRLFEAKKRPELKPIPILAGGVDDILRLAVLEADDAEAAARHWPGGLTLVVKRRSGLPRWVGDPERGTLGVRVPDHPLALEVLEATGPLAATSANRSTEPPAWDATEAEQALGDSVACYLPGAGLGGLASTVVDVSGATPRVLREGPVDWTRR